MTEGRTQTVEPYPIYSAQNLTAQGRKLVTIVDPHIKKDTSYWVHKDCTDKGLYVKNQGGNSIENSFSFSFGLKNGLTFHFDSLTCLNYPYMYSGQH